MNDNSRGGIGKRFNLGGRVNSEKLKACKVQILTDYYLYTRWGWENIIRI